MAAGDRQCALGSLRYRTALPRRVSFQNAALDLLGKICWLTGSAFLYFGRTATLRQRSRLILRLTCLFPGRTEFRVGDLFLEANFTGLNPIYPASPFRPMAMRFHVRGRSKARRRRGRHSCWNRLGHGLFTIWRASLMSCESDGLPSDCGFETLAAKHCRSVLVCIPGYRERRKQCCGRNPNA